MINPYSGSLTPHVHWFGLVVVLLDLIACVRLTVCDPKMTPGWSMCQTSLPDLTRDRLSCYYCGGPLELVVVWLGSWKAGGTLAGGCLWALRERSSWAGWANVFVLLKSCWLPGKQIKSQLKLHNIQQYKLTETFIVVFCGYMVVLVMG